ncbi:ABC transporter substrate-binding protein [Terrarubrum flagellatum]|uniref:ABC transporter substrate-binding protein n=1 Tax=Terrirubrum flagellatum TaxID=2895980 RepID=UPI00314537CC
MDRRHFTKVLGAATLAPLAAPAVHAQGAKLTLGVGGKPLLYYLPLTIAERRGFFKDEGLNVEINDFGGGAKSLQALVGGSVDVVTGAYEHTVRMQAKSQDIRAICELGRFPAIVIGVAKSKADKIKSASDLKGAKIGVTAPGSSTSITVQYAMLKAGLKPTDAAFIGVGGGASAVAAMKKGDIDAISHLDPVIAKLEADGDIVVLIDTRTEAGTKALFGGTNPAAVVYTRNDFIEKNPEAAQKVTNAFVKSLKWLASAKPEDVAASVPEDFYLGDKELYIRAVKNSLESYSRTGIISPEGMKSVYDMVKALDSEMASAQVDLSRTFVDRFVKKATSA